MPTAEQALVSEDAAVVKKLRGNVLSQVTVDRIILSKELEKKKDGKHDLTGISFQLVETQEASLRKHFSMFQKLHERLIEIRDETIEEEEKINQDDSTYYYNASSKVFPLLEDIKVYKESYKDALAKENKRKTLTGSLEERKLLLESARKEFVLVSQKIQQDAVDVIEKEDADSDKRQGLILALPTDSLIKDINNSYTEVKNNAVKLADAMKADGLSVDEIDKATTWETERATCYHLDLTLKVYDSIKKISLQKISHKSCSSEDTGVIGDKANPIKVSKPDIIKFNGQARDFASFKRDFKAIIVPHREAAQIGLLFKQGIPEKHRHLISNIELNDWESMMAKIETELATPKIIVDLTVGEIEKLKTPQTDKSFVDFVEILE